MAEEILHQSEANGDAEASALPSASSSSPLSASPLSRPLKLQRRSVELSLLDEVDVYSGGTRASVGQRDREEEQQKERNPNNRQNKETEKRNNRKRGT